MALVQSTLEASLLSLFSKPAKSAKDAADRTARAYNTYAQTALAGTGFPVFTGTEEAAFSAGMLAAFAVPRTGSPLTYAQAWVSAVIGFWTLPPVPFTLLPVDAGIPLPLVGADAILQASLVTVTSNLKNTAAVAASGIATAVDTYTRTFTVTFAPSAATFNLS